MASVAQRLINSGLGFWIVLALVGGWFLHPLRQKLKFGIDLVGGTYITLRVQVDKALEAELKDKFKDVEAISKENNLPDAKATKYENKKLFISYNNYSEAESVRAAVEESFKQDGIVVTSSGDSLVLSFNLKYQEKLEKWAVDSDIDVLRTRLNSLGVEDIKVAPQGKTDIVVELPDVSDFNKAKQIIGKPALLEFKLVEMSAGSKDEIMDRFSGQIPAGYEIVSYNERGSKVYLLVEDYAEVSGKHLKDAQSTVDQSGGIPKPAVSFTLTSGGSKKFAKLTEDNIGKQLAIVLDGKIQSAPVIRTAITGGSGVIQGSFSREEAKDLSTMLKSGAFVAPVTFEEERSVGPALGYESIKKGVVSCLVGLILLLLFSLIVYKISGLFAFFALIYNLFLLLLCMYLIGATLTLPGIAGMILTIGMAIDSSILIFERMKELLKDGESITVAVTKGFSGAMSVILDSNITTFIVGIVLFYLGTGPVKGFAVTLMVGIICTLIAGLFVLKSFFRCFYAKSTSQKLSI